MYKVSAKEGFKPEIKKISKEIVDSTNIEMAHGKAKEMKIDLPYDDKFKIAYVNQKLSLRLDYLYDRWQDEREYEDFKDYTAEMKALLLDADPTAKFIKSSKRPFGCTVFNLVSLWIKFY